MLINNFSYTKKRDKFYLYFQAYEGNINIDLLTDWLIDRLIDEIGILTSQPWQNCTTIFPPSIQNPHSSPCKWASRQKALIM